MGYLNGRLLAVLGFDLFGPVVEIVVNLGRVIRVEGLKRLQEVLQTGRRERGHYETLHVTKEECKYQSKADEVMECMVNNEDDNMLH